MQTGLLRADQQSYNTGRFEVAAGAALEFQGYAHTLETNSTITGAGALRLTGGDIVMNGTNGLSGGTEVSGPSTRVYFNNSQGFGSSNAPLIIDPAGTAFINVNVTLPSVSLTGGTLAGTGELTIPDGGVLTWTGGAMEAVGVGVTTIALGGTLMINGGNDKTLQGRPVNNNGTAIWSGSGRIVSRPSFGYGTVPNQIYNCSGAVFEVQSTALMQAADADPPLVINNAGTFRKTGAGTTNTLRNMSFTNTGTVEVQSGKLRLVGSSSSFANTGTVSFPISRPAPGIQFGQLEFGGVVLDGAISVSLANGFRPSGGQTFEMMQFVVRLGNFTQTNGLNLGGGLSFAMNYSSSNLTLVTVDIRPSLSLAAVLTNGQFQFQLAGQLGSNYVVQASTNLAAWIPIATNVIPGSGLIPFADPFATNFSRRFYRAVMP